MKAARIRLFVAVGLFVVWMGYLIHLAYTAHQQRAVLSAPQFLISEVDVVAEVKGPTQPVEIIEVLYPPAAEGQPKEKKLLIENLAECVVAKPQTEALKKSDPNTEPPAEEEKIPPGRYILPLVSVDHGKARVARIPASPGYTPGKPVIYPYSENAREQALKIPKAAGR